MEGFDPESIKTALEIVTRGSQATGSALQAIEKFKKLIGGSKAEQESQDLPRDEVEELVTALMSQLQNAKLANIDLKEQLVELREQALVSQRANEEFDRYELWQTPNENHVYRLKPGAAQGEHLHYICPTCKEDGTKSILQGDQYYKKCLKCKTGYDFQDHPTYGSSALDDPY